MFDRKGRGSTMLKNLKSGHPLPVLEAGGGEPEEERPAKQKNQDKNVCFLKQKQTL